MLNVPPAILLAFAGATVHWSFRAMDQQNQPLCVGEAKPLSLLP